MTQVVDNLVVVGLKPGTANSQLGIEGSECLVGLECLLNIVRALGMGSCLSVEGGGTLPYGPATPSGAGKRRNVVKKRQQLRRNDSKLEMWLHRIPGRLFLNGSLDTACLFSKQGKKGVNQDAMIIWENFGAKADTIFCGVFDGHGPFGHMVAKKVRDSLPLKLSAQLELYNSKVDGVSSVSSSATGCKISIDDPLIPVNGEYRSSDHDHKENRADDALHALKESFMMSFKIMDKELRLHPTIDSYCSGTTAVSLVKQGQDLVIGNVGDSRAVLGTRDINGALLPVQLTVDLKPNLPSEEERIRRCKGRVFALPNEPDVSRVWLPNSNSPGLAMARAFGDFCLKDFGLISVPEIYHHRITEKDEFVVLATDGVWDVLSNKEVVDVVASVPRPVAARSLVEIAVEAWKYKYPTSKIDDCAVVCLFLDSSPSNYSTYTIAEERILSPPDQAEIGSKDVPGRTE